MLYKTINEEVNCYWFWQITQGIVQAESQARTVTELEKTKERRNNISLINLQGIESEGWSCNI